MTDDNLLDLLGGEGKGKEANSERTGGRSGVLELNGSWFWFWEFGLVLVFNFIFGG